jgi:ubiquinone/menaquinone biosynthesis C-methylase UbiE
MAIRLFEGALHATEYVRYRPQYSTKVRKIIEQFMRKHKCSFDTIADVGCGSGQSLHFWTDSFKKCVGLDISEEQVKAATETFHSKDINNVEFHVCPAESLPKDLKNCDLVTIGAAWHWIDADAFYKEADRVLKSPGVLAVYSYSLPCIPSDPKASEILVNFYSVTLKDYWHPKRQQHVFNKYSDVHLPYVTAERHDFDQDWSVPLSHLIGYIRTWSGYLKYKERHPGTTILSEIHRDLSLALGSHATEDDPTVHCSYPIFMHIGLKQ